MRAGVYVVPGEDIAGRWATSIVGPLAVCAVNLLPLPLSLPFPTAISDVAEASRQIST